MPIFFSLPKSFSLFVSCTYNKLYNNKIKMAFVFRGDKPQQNNKPSNVGPGIFSFIQEHIILKYIMRIKYLKHMFHLVVWNLSLERVVMGWLVWLGLVHIILMCNIVVRRLLYRVRLRISRYWRYRGRILSSSQESIDFHR